MTTFCEVGLILQLSDKQNVSGVGEGKEEYKFLLLLPIHKTICSVQQFMTSSPRHLPHRITRMAALRLIGKSGFQGTIYKLYRQLEKAAPKLVQSLPS